MDSEKFELMKPEEWAAALSSENSVFLNVAKFEQMQRVATMISKTDFIPERFKGNIGNCMIALDMASLMGMHPIMLMRTMYVVHGQPGFEGKFISALINNSGRYVDPLEYEWKGEKGNPTWGCRAFAVRKRTGKTVYGPWVDWQMVINEKWNLDKSKNGQVYKSKWNTIAELMFQYRAAAFFGRVNDSDLLLGMRTIDEIEDMQEDLIKQPDGSYGVSQDKQPTENTYKVNATAPLQETPQQQRPAEKTQGPALDEFSTPIDSVFEKSKWFHLRAGSPEEGTGFAAYIAANVDKLHEASEQTYSAMSEKYQKLYSKRMPFYPDHRTADAQQAEQPAQHENVLDSEAAMLLASIAREHRREYIMVVKNQVPESAEQIYGWIDEINELIAKHAREKPDEQTNETF